jgi:hypothetical protein
MVERHSRSIRTGSAGLFVFLTQDKQGGVSMKAIKFNPQQDEAISHREGPMIVLSVAGSGKTMVLTERVIHLIEEGIDPGRLLAITFAKKAVLEIQSRLEKRLNGNGDNPGKGVDPGAVIAVQTFGDFLNFNPHCHVLCTDGGFFESGAFKIAPAFDTESLQKLFQHKILKMLLRKGKIMEEVPKLILSWRHSGFNVHCGPRIHPGDEEAMENLARYVVRASFSQERMTYIPDESKVVYRSKDGKSENIFDPLEWMAAMCSHVPNKGEQMVRYYGYYSNVSRGNRKRQNQDEWIPCILQPEESSREYRKNWARLIQKIYEVDPLTCPKCHGPMRVISFIEDQNVIKKILKHLNLWEVKPRPPPRMSKAQPSYTEPHIDYSDSQVPPSDNGFYVGPVLSTPMVRRVGEVMFTRFLNR